jgi:hypothetical protein
LLLQQLCGVIAMVNIRPVTLARRTWTVGIYVARGTLALRHTPTVRIGLQLHLQNIIKYLD